MVGERYEVDDLMHVALFVLNESWPLDLARPSGYWVGLYSRLKVCEAMSSKIPFEWVFLVGRAFLPPSCFLAFCHAVKVNISPQR